MSNASWDAIVIASFYGITWLFWNIGDFAFQFLRIEATGKKKPKQKYNS